LNIAVVGGGLAGLTAAWRLAAAHEVVLYERLAQPGFIAHGVEVPLGTDAAAGTARVDVPLRVFYPGYYPALLKLYAELGVATEPVSYATTFVDEGRLPYFRYRNLRWLGKAYGYVWPQDLANRRTRRVLAGALRFYKEAGRALRSGQLQGLTLAQYLALAGLPDEFVRGLLLPMVSTIGTCPDQAALAYPADVVVDYLMRGVSRQAVRRAQGGADDVAQRLLKRVHKLHCKADVRGLRRVPAGVELLHGDGSHTRHDHVVLATSAQQALRLLQDASASEQQLLGAVRHHRVDVLLHRDARLMPAHRRDWSPVNALVAPGLPQAMATIWVNAVQPALRDAPPLFQTVAPAPAAFAARPACRARKACLVLRLICPGRHSFAGGCRGLGFGGRWPHRGGGNACGLSVHPWAPGAGLSDVALKST
jgi:uncharacterized protein